MVEDCKWIVVLDAFEAPDEYIEAGADALCIGLDDFSSRIRVNADLDALKNFASILHEQGVELFVNMQAMVEENRVDDCRQAFDALLDAGIDGIYAADDAFLQFASEYDALHPDAHRSAISRLIIQPETLINAPEDTAFFEELGVQAVSLSHELTTAEMAACAQGNPHVEVLISGRYSWMESRRPLVENYLLEIGREEKFTSGSIYTLVEQSRQNQMPVWQDERGTHVLSDRPFEAGAHLAELYRAGIRRFRIDALLEGNRTALERLIAYKNYLDRVKEEKKKDKIRHLVGLDASACTLDQDIVLSPALKQAAAALPSSTIPESEMSIRKEKGRVEH